MIGLKTDMVELLPYDYTWKDEFQKMKKDIEMALNGYAFDVQHVGSTSIEGCPAKPVIDINICIESLEYGNQLVPLLINIGYIYKGDDGIPGRHYFKKQENGVTVSHIHMCPIGNEIWKNQILFRDYMREHPEQLQEYIGLKRKLAILYPTDRASYSLGKKNFIENILVEAEALKRSRKK